MPDDARADGRGIASRPRHGKRAAAAGLPGNGLRLEIRIVCRDELVIDSVGAALLDTIASSGSISAAARTLGISFPHGWKLVRALNNRFAEPLVEATVGGANGGRSVLTDTGNSVLQAYQRMMETAQCNGARDLRLVRRAMAGPDECIRPILSSDDAAASRGTRAR
jgi:molybdate transport system regulatory protein